MSENAQIGPKVRIKTLDSGYIRLQGNGPCNWVQVPYWPCDEKTIREHAFPEASETFIQEILRYANQSW